MKKEFFDLDWEFHEVFGLSATLMGVPSQPINLPLDTMISKPRAAENS